MALISCKECGNQVSTEAKVCPKCGAKVPKKTGIITKALIFFFLVGLIGVIFGGHNGPPGAAPAPEADPHDVAMQALNIKHWDWNKGGFGAVMFIDITFENTGKRDVKDIELTCTHSGNSGTVIDSNKRVIYDTVPAGKTKTITHFDMGFVHEQAVKSHCDITDLTVI